MANSEIVNESTGELVPVEDKSLVFGTQDPQAIIEKATVVANRLVDIVEKAKLYSMIKDKKYVKAEGWTTMAAMLGVFPSVIMCEKLDRTEEIAYAAKVVLNHISGAQVGAGEAICSSAERSWSGRDEYAVKSMAQTRALGKACRLSFSWIMALAGYEACPAEEMINDLPTRQVAMPKSRAVSGEDRVVPTSDLPDAIGAGAVGTPSEPRALTAAEEAALMPPVSKFFATLHKLARDKNVPVEKLKWVIKESYGKSSSKLLSDAECAALIKLIERDALK